jgi:hypothetical protein
VPAGAWEPAREWRWAEWLAHRRVLWLALGLAAALRGLAWWWAAAPQLDELSYQSTAGWLIERGQQVLFWPPLTGWLIAAVYLVGGPSVALARLLWLGLDLINVVLLWRLAGAVPADAATSSGTRPLRGLVVLAHAVSLPAISYAVHTTSEIPAVTLVLTLLLLLAPTPARSSSHWRAAVAGACGGALVLTRPSLALVPLALAVLLVRESGALPPDRRRWVQAALLVGLTGLVPGAYISNNWRTTGHAVLAQNTSYNLHRGNGPVYQEDLNLFWPMATAAQIDYRRRRANNGEEPPLTLTPAEMRREAFAYIRSYPLLFARRALGRLARLTVPRTEHLTLLGGEESIRIEDGRSVALLFLGLLQWVPLLCLGTVGLLGLRRDQPPGTRPWFNRVGLVLGAGIAPVLIAISKPRFAFVFEPLLLIAAAAFVVNRRAWRPLLRHPVAIALGLFYAWAWMAWFVFAVTSRTGP